MSDLSEAQHLNKMCLVLSFHSASFFTLMVLIYYGYTDVSAKY